MESNKKYLLSILILLCFNLTFSQTFFENSTWLKNDSTNKEEILSSDSLNQNFNDFIRVNNLYPNENLKNIVNNYGSLFLVVKSNVEEDNLILIKGKSFSTKIAATKVVSDKEFELKETDLKKGSLISYHYNLKSKRKRKKGDVIINTSFLEPNSSQLYELIYFPEIIGNKKRKAIESYLSIKYGISLLDDKNYINSKLDTIWNFKNNKEFSNNITGIGKDSVFDLNQKQSVNINDDNISIALGEFSKMNYLNNSELINNSFLLWGDNGKPYSFENDKAKKNNLLKRVWKVESYSKERYKFITQLKIKKSLLNLEDDYLKEKVCLLIDTLSTSIPNIDSSIIYKISKVDDEYLFFDNVEWEANKNYLFTLAIRGNIDELIEESRNHNAILVNEALNDLKGKDNIYSIYPNPIKANEEFNIYINLKKESRVYIWINDMTGKTVTSRDLGNVSEINHTESLSSAGTFIVSVQIDNQVLSNKIIVE